MRRKRTRGVRVSNSILKRNKMLISTKQSSVRRKVFLISLTSMLSGSTAHCPVCSTT